MAEERKRPSLHDHSTSTRPSSTSMRPSSSMRDAKPRDEKKPGDTKGPPSRRACGNCIRRIAARSATCPAIIAGRGGMMLRHEKAIADMQEKQDREMTGAPRWRKV